mgnify:CR=1 FL=1
MSDRIFSNTGSKKLEKQEQKMLDESIDPQILIPETHEMADYRQDVLQFPMSLPNKDDISPYDSSFDSHVSPYQRFRTNTVQSTNNRVAATEQRTLISDIEKPIEDMVHLTRQEYEKLKKLKQFKDMPKIMFDDNKIIRKELQKIGIKTL